MGKEEGEEWACRVWRRKEERKNIVESKDGEQDCKRVGRRRQDRRADR